MVNRTCRFRGGTKSYRRFEGKSYWVILGGINRTDDLRVNRTWQFEGGKSYRRFEGKLDLVIWGEGGKLYRQFEDKSDLAILGG